MAFNTDQLMAINDRDHTLLVSAAAGSGKTSVLIERMISRITDENDPISIGEILCVTFTNAAASEIKARLSKALGEAVEREPENKRLLRQLAIADSAQVETIDSFFFKVIKRNFDKLGLPPSLSLMDEDEANVFLDECCDEVLEELYESENADGAFFELVENFSKSSNDGNFKAFVENAYKALEKKPEPEKYLEETAEFYEKVGQGQTDFMKSPWGLEFAKAMREDFAFAMAQLDEMAPLIANDKNIDAYHEMYESFAKVRRLLEKPDPADYKELSEAVNGLFAMKRCDKAKAYLKDVKSVIERYLAKNKGVFSFTEEEIREHALICALMIKKFALIFERLDAVVFSKKKQKGRLSFSDLPRLCHKLLLDKNGDRAVPSAVCNTVAKEFKEIYIDEYQDTDEYQDALFSAIAESTCAPRFMVGDVKQCIYAFRNSDPSIFTSYYSRFNDIEADDASECRRVSLKYNYRSDLFILEFVNTVCSALMTDRLGGVSYDDNARLRSEKEEGINKVTLLCASNEDKLSAQEKKEKHAQGVADEIIRLIREEKDEKGDPFTFSDFAVLYRSGGSWTPVFAAEFEKRGIPTNVKKKEDFFSLPHVEMLLGILRAIDNPASDVCLATAMSSPLFSFDISKLLEIKDGQKDKSLYDCLCQCPDKEAKHFKEELLRYRTLASALGVRELIYDIGKNGFDKAIGGAYGEKGRNDVYRLCSYANKEAEYDLSAFLSKVEKLKSSQTTNESGVGGVTVSTVHASKGLEYKVCFLVGMEDSITNPKEGSSVNSDTFKGKIHAAFPLMHNSGFFKIEPAFYIATKTLKKKFPVSEEARVFYVAMTRAKQRLYLSLCKPQKEIEELVEEIAMQKEPAAYYKMANASCRFEWIVRAFAKELGGDELYSLFVGGKSLEKIPFFLCRHLTEKGEDELDKGDEPGPVCGSWGDPSYVYPHLESSITPAKVSVSDISKKELRERFTGFGSQNRSPAFLGGEPTGADIGNAMHAFMQFCDFERAKKDGEREAERLVELLHISPEQKAMLDFEKIARFFESPLYAQMLSAKKIYREQRFNLPLKDKSEVLLQGVIDCFFEDKDGQMNLLDFKTDRIKEGEESELLDRYGEQLRLYADAVEAMTGKKPSHAYLYSFALSKSVEAELEQ